MSRNKSLPVAKRRAAKRQKPTAKAVPKPKPRVAAKRQKLTKAVVVGLKPMAKEYTIWDAEVPRLGCRVLPTGAKVFVLRLRLNGRQRWLKIGRLGDVTTEQARAEAQRLLGRQMAGDDPTTARVRQKESPTVEALGRRFLDEYGAAHLKESSLRTYGFNFDNHIADTKLGKMRVDTVTRADVEPLHHELGREKPYAANRVRALLHSMFRFAEDVGLRPQNTNPARGIRAFKEKARRRYLSPDEWMRLGQALTESEEESLFVVAAFRLLALTGCRCSEIFRLKWAEVDLDRGVLELVDSKTGAKTVPLNEAAASILAELPRVEGNPHVIPGWLHGQPYQGEAKAWERIKTRAKLEDVRIHDLRHSFASVAVGDGAGLPVVGALLGHTQAATTMRYSHIAQDPARAVSETTSSTINGWLGTPAPKGIVTPFRRKR